VHLNGKPAITMECISMILNFSMQMWIGRQRRTDIARGMGEYNVSLEDKIADLERDIKQKPNDKMILDWRVEQLELKAVNTSAGRTPDYNLAVQWQSLAGFYSSLKISTKIQEFQDSIRDLRKEKARPGCTNVQLINKNLESAVQTLRFEADLVFLNPEFYWVWMPERGVWEKKVLEMRLHEADEEDENHQFEILISDTMQDKNSQQVIELSTTTVIYDQGPYDAVTIPVPSDSGKQQNEPVFLISLRPFRPVRCKNTTPASVTNAEGVQVSLPNWVPAVGSQPDHVENKQAAGRDPFKYQLLIGCKTLQERTNIEQRCLRAGARFGFAVGFSTWGGPPYNYPDIETALSTIRKNDMVRLKGEYAVYDEQVTITTPCSIVGDDETCMIINRQVVDQPSVVAMPDYGMVFLSNLSIRAASKEGNQTSGVKAPAPAKELNPNSQIKVFGSGALEVMLPDTQLDMQRAETDDEQWEAFTQTKGYRKALFGKKTHKEKHDFHKSEKNYLKSLEPPEAERQIPPEDKLWPFTTFVLFLERNICAGKLTSHVITEAEASDNDKLMDSKMHSADDGIYNVRLENVNITDANIGVFVHKQAELEMNNCVITMCSDTGMIVADGGKVACYSCQISDNDRWGLAVYGAHEDQLTRLSTPSEALLYDCTVRSNAFAGAACWDRGHISMQHCTVADNRGAGFDMLTKTIIWQDPPDNTNEDNHQSVIKSNGSWSIQRPLTWGDFMYNFDNCDAVEHVNCDNKPWKTEKMTPMSTADLRHNLIYNNSGCGVSLGYGSSVWMERNFSYHNSGEKAGADRQFSVRQGVVYNHLVQDDNAQARSRNQQTSDWRYSISSGQSHKPARSGKSEKIGEDFNNVPWQPGVAFLVVVDLNSSNASINLALLHLGQLLPRVCAEERGSELSLLSKMFCLEAKNCGILGISPTVKCSHVHHAASDPDKAKQTNHSVHAIIQVQGIPNWCNEALRTDETHDHAFRVPYAQRMSTAFETAVMNSIEQETKKLQQTPNPHFMTVPYTIEGVRIESHMELSEYQRFKAKRRKDKANDLAEGKITKAHKTFVTGINLYKPDSHDHCDAFKGPCGGYAHGAAAEGSRSQDVNASRGSEAIFGARGEEHGQH